MKGRTVYWTPERILEAIRRFYEREGRWPIKSDLVGRGTDVPHAVTVHRAFGTLAEARRRAGMPGGGFEGLGGPGRGGGPRHGSPCSAKRRGTYERKRHD